MLILNLSLSTIFKIFPLVIISVDKLSLDKLSQNNPTDTRQSSLDSTLSFLKLPHDCLSWIIDIVIYNPMQWK